MHKLVSIIALSVTLTAAAYAGGSGAIIIDGQSYTYWQNGPYLNVNSSPSANLNLTQEQAQAIDLVKLDAEFKASMARMDARMNAANKAFAKGASLETVIDSNWVPRAELVKIPRKGGK